MQGYVCPAKRAYCPSSQEEIQITLHEENKAVSREYIWPNTLMLPTEEAKDWHCKYKIEVDPVLIERLTNQSKQQNYTWGVQPVDQGRLVVEIHMHGFEDYAYIILQHHNFFKDITDKQEDDEVQKLLPLRNGMVYVFPGEFDALITFAPKANFNGTQQTNKGGWFIVKATYRLNVNYGSKTGSNVINILRPGETNETYFVDDSES